MMHRSLPRTVGRICTWLLAWGLIATAVQGAEGRIEVNVANFGPPPFVLANPGHYILTEPVSVPSGPAFMITASCVELDLNGMTVRSSANTGSLVSIMNGRRDITVRNGCLVGAAYGVHYSTTSNDPTIVNLIDLQIHQSAQAGIHIFGAEQVEIRGCQVREIAGTYAIYLDGILAPFGGQIVGNTVENVEGWGMYLEGFQGGTLQANMIRRFGLTIFGASGVWLSGSSAWPVGGNRVVGNTLSLGSNLGTGLTIGDASHGNLVLENDLFENTRNGLWIGSTRNTTVRGNNVTSNGQDGVVLLGGNRNVLDDNQVSDNGGNGISLSHSDRNVLDDNQVSGNGASGLSFDTFSNDNLCRDNLVHFNLVPWTGPSQVDLGNYPVGLCQ